MGMYVFKIKNFIKITINIDIKPFITKLKRKRYRFKILLNSKINPNKLYYNYLGFGFYSVGTFGGFDGDMMKLKKGEKSWTTGLYYNFYESKQPNMKELNKI